MNTYTINNFSFPGDVALEFLLRAVTARETSKTTSHGTSHGLTRKGLHLLQFVTAPVSVVRRKALLAFFLESGLLVERKFHGGCAGKPLPYYVGVPLTSFSSNIDPEVSRQLTEATVAEPIPESYTDNVILSHLPRSEKDLCSKLQRSRTTVRSTLLRLMKEGRVTWHSERHGVGAPTHVYTRCD